MKLSSNTMNVLKNFSTINENIFIKPGNVLETISKQKNILARAEIAESFSEEFGIHDLNNFLSVLTLSKDSSPESNTKYRKASKEVLVIPPEKKINMDNAEISFSLSAEDLDWFQKAASALNSPNIAFMSDGQKINVQIFDAKDDSSNVNTTTIAESDGKIFKMIFATENFKFIPGNYQVTIHSKGISHFKNTGTTLEYWVATEAGSSYEA
jgi:hypothetical protein